MSALSFGTCVAKTAPDGTPGCSVVEHSRNAAEVARVLAALFNSLPHVRLFEGAESIAAVHDVGKVSPGFQKARVRNPAIATLTPDVAAMADDRFETDHACIGASAVSRFCAGGSEMPAAAQVVGLHHGSIRKPAPPRDTGKVFGGESWAEERRKLIARLVEEFGPLPQRDLPPVARNAIAGLVTVADWIASDERFFPPEGLPASMASVDAAAHAVDTCGFRMPGLRLGLAFTDVFGFPPHDLQARFADAATEPGLYVLEAPMGMGKTEAALYAAYRLMCKGHNRGFYFGLPTRLTSDRIHRRVADFLDRVCDEDVVAKLAHGTAWLKSFAHGGGAFGAGRDWFSSRKRTLLHPFGVGTIDQALLSVLRVKHFFVRTFALAGKVVILDEVHSYDVYTSNLMEEMVHQLLELGCTVIILSATLNSERRSRFFTVPSGVPGDEDYPIITWQRDGETGAVAGTPPEPRTYSVRVAGLNDAQTADEAVIKAQAGHCVLCIANTVARAQQWHGAIAAAMPEGAFELGLLHSKFPAFRRNQLEDRWIEKLGKNGDRPGGCVLVATQVVEQSVDIDADHLITELAPTDMLLQRMGRQWRHPRRKRPSDAPEVVIVTRDPHDAGTSEDIVEILGKTNCFVYAPYVLWRSLELWRHRDTVTLPCELRDLIEKTYRSADGEPAAVVGLRRLFEQARDKLRRIAESAKATVTGLPTGNDREGIATRYSDLPTTQTLLVRQVDSTGRSAHLELLDGGVVQVDADRPDFPVTARLHENLVSIATYLLAKTGRIETPPFLAKHFHEATPVLVWDEESSDLLRDGGPTGLGYTHCLGLRRSPTGPCKVCKQSTEPFSEHEEFDVFDLNRFDW